MLISYSEQDNVRKEKFEHLAFDEKELAEGLNGPIAAQKHGLAVKDRNAWIDSVIMQLKQWDIETNKFDQEIKKLLKQFNASWFVQSEINKLWPIADSIHQGNPQTSIYWNNCAELFMALQNLVIDPLYIRPLVPRFFTQ